MISLSLHFNNSVAPDMVNMIDIRDERNPLNIKESNPLLGDSHIHSPQRRYTSGARTRCSSTRFQATDIKRHCRRIYLQHRYRCAFQRYITLTETGISKSCRISAVRSVPSRYSALKTPQPWHTCARCLVGENNALPTQRVVKNWGCIRTGQTQLFIWRRQSRRHLLRRASTATRAVAQHFNATTSKYGAGCYLAACQLPVSTASPSAPRL